MSINQDRPFTCVHFFADGRRCQLPPSADDMGLCYFHAKKFQDRLNAEQAGRHINEFLSTDILTACDLNAALATLFAATSQGYIKPKTTIALTYLGNLLLQTQKLAKMEFVEAFDDRWPEIVQKSLCFDEPDAPPAPEAPAAQSTNPTLTPANDAPSDEPNPDPTHPEPIPFRKIM
jgi:hypothetical protein